MPAVPLVLLEDVRHIEITDPLGEPARLVVELHPDRPVTFQPESGGDLALWQTVAIPVPDGRIDRSRDRRPLRTAHRRDRPNLRG